MYDTINLTDRIATTKTNFAGTATDAASTVYQKTHAIATGLPAKAAEAFYHAFERAMASFAQYGAMTARAYESGYGNYSTAYNALRRSFEATSPKARIAASEDAIRNFLAGSTDLAIGNLLGTPFAKALDAGAKILSGNVTLATVSQVAFPVITVICVGYAALKLRELAESKLADLSEAIFDGFEDESPEDIAGHFAPEDDDGDFHAVDIEDLDDDERGAVEDAVEDAIDDDGTFDTDDFDIVGDSFKEGSTDA